ncbi:hypothetical protein NW766_010161 [Fusarium irregulare]|uniref:Uncharacterized protein n=1 Tax=Fusarium irregulare TaxID=2494466 RepID=A0A9W8PI32_9HYPO|nr:hypothetical protein NW766_010161 [Fusarium irregulare]
MASSGAKRSPAAQDQENNWKSYVEPHVNFSEYVLEKEERVIITKSGFDTSAIYLIVEACPNDEYKVKQASDNKVLTESIKRIYIKRVA